jgi:hypothetical protein
MRNTPKKRDGMRIPLVTGLLFGLLIAGCSKAPTLSQEELLKVLAEVNRVGPLNFQQKVWPLLEKKTITYCGPLEASKVAGTESVLLFKVDKTSTGEKLPWLLEAKSASPDLASLHKAGESVCMTGSIDGYMFHDPSYWGYVKIQSVDKPRAS